MRFIDQAADCAVVIPTRDRAQSLLKTLTRLADTPGPDLEIVIVDNGSVDGTAGHVVKAFPKVRIIPLPTNRGATARNDGIRQAKSPIVLTLDDDSGPFPGTVEKLVTALEDPSLGIAACPVLMPDGRFEEGGSRYVPVGCGAAFRRDVLLSLGGFHPEYKVYVEEYDLAYRFLAADLAVRYIDDAPVWHEPAPRPSLDHMVEMLTANNAYLATKFFPRVDALRFISWMVYRYSQFAAKKNATAGFQRGMERLADKVIRGDADHTLLPERVLDQVLPHRNTAPTFINLIGRGVERVAFLRAGKELPGLLTAAQNAGLKIEAIFEPPDGLFAEHDRLFDVPVRPLSAAHDADDATLVIGGTSYGFVRNTLALAQRAGLPTPLVP